jgi:hypothetical protein
MVLVELPTVNSKLPFADGPLFWAANGNASARRMTALFILLLLEGRYVLLGKS